MRVGELIHEAECRYMQQAEVLLGSRSSKIKAAQCNLLTRNIISYLPRRRLCQLLVLSSPTRQSNSSLLRNQLSLTLPVLGLLRSSNVYAGRRHFPGG